MAGDWDWLTGGGTAVATEAGPGQTPEQPPSSSDDWSWLTSQQPKGAAADLSDLATGVGQFAKGAGQAAVQGARSIAAGIPGTAEALGDVILKATGRSRAPVYDENNQLIGLEPSPVGKLARALAPEPMQPSTSGAEEAGRFVGGVVPWVVGGFLAPEALIPLAGTATLADKYAELRAHGVPEDQAFGIAGLHGANDAALFAIMPGWADLKLGSKVMSEAAKAIATGGAFAANDILHNAIEKNTTDEDVELLTGAKGAVGKGILLHTLTAILGHAVGAARAPGQERTGADKSGAPGIDLTGGGTSFGEQQQTVETGAPIKVLEPDQGGMPAREGEPQSPLREMLGAGASEPQPGGAGESAGGVGDAGEAGAQAQAAGHGGVPDGGGVAGDVEAQPEPNQRSAESLSDRAEVPSKVPPPKPAEEAGAPGSTNSRELTVGQRTLMRETKRVGPEDPRFATAAPRADLDPRFARDVQQNDLSEILPAGTKAVYHETNLKGADAILGRTERVAGGRALNVDVSDNPDLALGQGGKGVLLEFDPKRVNGGENRSKPGLAMTKETGSGSEYTLDQFANGPVSAMTIKNKATFEAARKRFGARFDFENPTETERGMRVERKVLDRKAELRANIADDLAKLSKKTTAGSQGALDPDTLATVVELAKSHIELGAREFADWSKEMVETAGEHIRPYLQSAWSAAQRDRAIAEAPKATGIEALDRWLGARDLVDLDANVQADRHEKEILATVPKRTLGQAVREGSETGSAQPMAATSVDRALQIYIDTKNAELQGGGTEAEQFEKYGAKFTPEQTALREAMLKLTPEQKAIGDAIVEENRKRGEEAQNLGVLGNLQEAYNTRLWDMGEDRPAGAVGKFTLDTSRQKARSLESIYQGWASGLELKVKGAIAAQKLGEKQLGHVMADRSMMVLGEANGLISDQEHRGWVKLEHPGFTKFIQRGEGPLEGSKGYKVAMYAEPTLGNRLNKILEPSHLDRITGVKQLTKAAEVTKASILFTSFFHHRAFLITHMFSTPDVFQAMRPIEAMKRGREAVQAGDEVLRAGVRNGLTLGQIQDYDELARREKTAIGAKIDKIAGVGQAARLMHAMLDQQQNFLFHKMSPALKANAFMLEMRAQMKANRVALGNGERTIDDVAKNAAKLVNDQFGGINLKREGRSPTAQHAFRLLALAPDWTETKIRLMANSLKPGADGAAYRASWARVVVRAGAATILGNLAMSVFDDGKKAVRNSDGTVTWEKSDEPNTLISRYKQAWDEGKLRWMDVDVTPALRALGANPDSRKYLSLVGHYHDPVKMFASPLDYTKHKGSVLTRLAADAFTGEDYKGARFTTASELAGVDDKGTYKTSGPGRTVGSEKGGKLAGQTVTYKPGDSQGSVSWQQLPSFLLNESKSMTPIQIQNAASWLNGEMDAFDAITRSLGLMESAAKPPKAKAGSARSTPIVEVAK